MASRAGAQAGPCNAATAERLAAQKAAAARKGLELGHVGKAHARNTQRLGQGPDPGHFVQGHPVTTARRPGLVVSARS